MAVLRAGNHGIVGQSSAKVIDGNLTLDNTSQIRYLIRTPTIEGNRKILTWSFWINRERIGEEGNIFAVGDTSTEAKFRFNANDTLEVSDGDGAQITTTRVFRNLSTFYHVVAILDSTQFTEANRFRIYVNGELEAVSATYPDQNDSGDWNRTIDHYLGRQVHNTSNRLTANLTDIFFIDGRALTPDNFGFTDPLTGTWRPKKFDIRAEHNSNNGTTWDSTNTTAYDGGVQTDTVSGTSTFTGVNGNFTSTLSSSVIVKKSLRLQMYASIASFDTYCDIQVNGSGEQTVTVHESQGSQAGIYDLNFTGTLSSIKVTAKGGANVGLAQVIVDDYVLINGAGDNKFYLPMDGNSSFADDITGAGNNWTPINLSGFVALDKATGAKPILNTLISGNVPRPGVFGSDENQFVTVTVASKTGGGNAYFFGGVERDSLSALRGTTVTFNTTDSTNNTHPFKLSSTNADSSGGTEYTDGVAYYINGSVVSGSDYVTNYSSGAASGFRGIKWTIPHNVSTTYYYCTAHNGMGEGGRLISTTDETKADPYAWKCVLALPLVGSKDDLSNSINATSATKSVTNNSTVTFPYTFGNFYDGSALFSGSNSLTVASNSDFAFPGDFTWEMWIRPTSSSVGSHSRVIEFGDTSWAIYIYPASNPYGVYAQLGSQNVTIKNSYKEDQWTHFAIVKSGSNAHLFVNGTLRHSAANSSTMSGPRDLDINGRDNSSYMWPGYMQDLRIYAGVAKYTSSFIPASTSPSILPDTPSGVSGSSKLAKVTDGAVGGFETVSDYLSVSASSDFEFTGDHTIEFFVYHNTLANDSVPYSTGGSGAPDQIYISAAGAMNYAYGQTGALSAPAGTIATKKWYHIAVSKSGTNLRMFVDGKIVASSTNHSSTIGSSSNGPRIGARRDGNHPTQGFISNLRVVKGTGVYTSEFTPPTRTLTNVTNTKLLCCQSNSEGPQKTAVIPSVTGTAYAMWPVNSDINDDSGNNRTLTENGGSTSFLSADANKFGITNAANFVKDGKYLSYAVTPASAWTIDGYIRLETATTSAPYILGWNGTNGSDTSFGFPSDGTLKFQVFGSFGVLDSGVVAEIGRWYHIRMTTNSTSDLKLFVDGVLVAQQTSSDGGPASPITFGDVQSGRFSGQVAGVRYTPTDLGAPVLGGEVTSNGVTTNSPPVGIKLNGNVSADNFNPFTTDINAVRGQETRYCTLNPLDKSPQTNIVLTNGNLDAANTSSSGQGRVDGTIAFSSGKWYFEGTVTGSSNYHEIGIIKTDQLLAYGIGFYSGGYSYNQAGNKFNSNATVTYGGSYTTGDTIGVAFNLDKGTLVFYKNGVSRGIAYTGLSGEFTFTVGTYSSGANFGWSSNFGQKPFKYAPPEGFQPLNAANVTPETVITRPTNFVDVRSGLQAQYKITDLDFKTDLTIAKSTSNSEYWIWADSVRGFNGGLKSDTTNADGSGLAIANVNGNGYESDSNWFTGSRTYTTYNFKAGGNKNTFNIDDVGYASAAAANMSVGSLNSASYNQTQTWSNNVTTTGNSGTFLAKTAMFDADLTNYTHCNGDGSAAVSVRLTLSPAVQCNSSVSLFGGITSGTSGTITINGTTTFNLTPCATVNPAFSDVTTVPFSGPITSITITKTTVNAAGMILYGWRIDDKLLIDNGVTPTNSPSLAATGASVGTKQGFSIIKYAGSNNSSAETIPHGLSQKPDFMIIKQLTDSSTAWTIYHSASNVKPNLKYLEFDDGDITDATGPWGDFDPTSSVFTVGSGYNNVNRVSRNFISFHWHNVPGLQKFGSYTGNNDSDAADGPFVELGFRPSLLWIKRLGTGNWIVYDNKRDTINPLDGRLKLNTDGANVDNSGYNLDFLSNGFKITGGNNDNYNAASTYIYCAWAEAPEFNLYGGQSNAR